VLFYGPLIKILRLAFDDFEGIVWAFSQTGSKPIAKFLRNQSGFTVDDLDGSLGAGWDTVPATVTFFFIDLNDLPFDFHVFLPQEFSPQSSPRKAEHLKNPNHDEIVKSKISPSRLGVKIS
jgi:hypothetical protein